MMNKTLSLSALEIGGSAVVRDLRCCAGLKKRILDMGLVPGARVTAVLSAPLGDPRAYLVNRTIISLRNEDAGNIFLTREEF